MKRRCSVACLFAWPIALLALTAAWPGDVRAEATSLAVFTEVNGDVTVTRIADQEELAEVDMELHEGDEISVPKGANATISFLDDHLLKLSERTCLILKSIKTDPKTDSFWGRMLLRVGSLLASLNELTDPQSGFEVETGNAIRR